MNKIEGVILLFIVFSLAACKKEKNRICDLYSNPVGYSIGIIESTVSVSIQPKVTHKYKYEVNGVNYYGNEKSYGIGQNKHGMVGKQFIVVYALSNPSNSDLNMDFFIKSENGFLEFKNKYTNAPPPPDFPNNCK